jgi:hypothetical protein
MSNFVRGWKRKTGIITLIAAMALTSAWIRSLSYLDDVMIFAGTSTVQAIYSNPNHLAWVWSWRQKVADGTTTENEPRDIRRILSRPGYWVMMEPSRKKRVYWQTTIIRFETDEETGEMPTCINFDFQEAFPQIRWYWNRYGFRFGSQSKTWYEAVVLNVPYWLLVCPLTLLTVYLLLGNPRSAKALAGYDSSI